MRAIKTTLKGIVYVALLLLFFDIVSAYFLFYFYQYEKGDRAVLKYTNGPMPSGLVVY